MGVLINDKIKRIRIKQLFKTDIFPKCMAEACTLKEISVINSAASDKFLTFSQVSS